ncbi:MAG: hypothetical protein RBS37_02980 [Bacteroidales bacterium]|jgi:hypothetical protein|nr:hypothetical protein [Bacteroidales bacterium]
MEWFRILALVSAAVCLTASLYHFIRLVRTGKPVDYALRAGDTTRAIIYSMTGAMSPAKKESAYLHLPAYAAGIIYHLGTFLALLLFVILLAGFRPAGIIRSVITLMLAVTTVSGLWILIRRFLNTELRLLSNPDDYISNLLVTLFHAGTIAALNLDQARVFYFVEASLLLLYLPVGKLRHTIYFFAARYHLGYFFGYRGTWPPVKQ